MPRTLRQTSTVVANAAAGRSGLDAKPLGRINNAKTASEVTAAKKFGDKSGVSSSTAVVAAGGKTMAQKRRAALGEITNALAETKSQAKKGLSKMINISRSSLTRQASLRKAKSLQEEQLQQEAKRPKTSGGGGSSRLRQRDSEPMTLSEEVDDDSSTEYSSSGQHNVESLPSSQEVVFTNCRGLKAEEEDDEDSDTYESAEEGESSGRPTTSNSSRKDLFLAKARIFPPNVIDFDALNVDDPNQVSEYVNETFQYYKDREAQFRCPDYIRTVQTDISPSMRAILVDWLVEVQESFELNHETLYTAVKLLDLYLSKVRVKKEQLQLIGATACLISCKIDERLPPLLDDFVYVCDDAYCKDDIKRKEIEMIGVVGYDVGYPLTYRFLRRYGRVCQVTMPVLTLGRYILEMALMEYGLNVETSESRLAAAALVLTFRLKGIVEGNWEETLRFYSGYAVDDCRELALRLHKMLLRAPHETRRTIRTKYEHEVFHSVALIPIPNEISI